MRKKFIFALGTVLSVALSAAQAFGAVYYVATDGSDSAAGSKDKPFATLNKANKVVHAGDTVWIRGGIYDLNDTVFLSSSAESAASIAMPRNGYLPGLHATRGAAIVFDLQGRLLGNLQFEQINGNDGALAGMLRAKFRNPGTYIVRSGCEIRKVQVNP